MATLTAVSAPRCLTDFNIQQRRILIQKAAHFKIQTAASGWIPDAIKSGLPGTVSLTEPAFAEPAVKSS